MQAAGDSKAVQVPFTIGASSPALEVVGSLSTQASGSSSAALWPRSCSWPGRRSRRARSSVRAISPTPSPTSCASVAFWTCSRRCAARASIDNVLKACSDDTAGRTITIACGGGLEDSTTSASSVRSTIRRRRRWAGEGAMRPCADRHRTSSPSSSSSRSKVFAAKRLAVRLTLGRLEATADRRCASPSHQRADALFVRQGLQLHHRHQQVHWRQHLPRRRALHHDLHRGHLGRLVRPARHCRYLLRPSALLHSRYAARPCPASLTGDQAT